jgi:hypothetical protein
MAGSEYYDKSKYSIDAVSPSEWDAIRRQAYDNDPVNNPSHYNAGNIETIDYIVDVLGEYDAIHYCHGNVLKYLGSRLWNKGNPKQDAKKAQWYLNKMIELIEKTEGKNW